MIGRVFRAHGEFCASHPWEVIVALLTVTACVLSVDRSTLSTAIDPKDTTTSTSSTSSSPQQVLPSSASSRFRPCHGWRESCDGLEAEYNAADVILMTIVRCTAVLYCYYQFCNLQKLGSKYILGIAGLFTVFSSFIFTTTIIKFLGTDLADLKDAFFILLLLIDLRNSGTLAQLALFGTNQAEVTENIARGMELLGPAITLDTMVEALVIGVGTLSGVQRLEILCSFAVLSVIVNYIVFMTFYPAVLSLILDLSRTGTVDRLVAAQNQEQSSANTTGYVQTKDGRLIKALNLEENKSNPVVQRVKIIMTTGLMVVHIYSRVVFSGSSYDDMDQILAPKIHTNANNRTQAGEFSSNIIRWLTMSADQIVILILLLSLAIKFMFFENRSDLHDQLRRNKSDVNTQTDESLRKPIFTIEDQPISKDESTQTDKPLVRRTISNSIQESKNPPRDIEKCLEILNSEEGASNLSDEEIQLIIKAGNGYCPLYKIETVIGDPERGVKIRRKIVGNKASLATEKFHLLPYKNFDYTKVMNACCENVIGYLPIPVGYAGPLLLDEKEYYVPMATTEGALVASTNRGCKALSVRGVASYVEDVGMTRAPCVKFPNVAKAACAKRWIEDPENFKSIKKEFDSTSRFGRLKNIFVAMDGPLLYIRFVALTGDAMGMNMVSKGSEMALKCLQLHFPDMQIISLSGNFCSDKKPAAINWIKGRGKKVVTECIISATTLRQVLKTDAKTLVECNKLKNMTGSAMAGSIGGNNAHAANMVTAVFIATGQDPAQNVTSSNCSTGMECCGENGDDLYMTCTMPSLEVGTVGGGTGLPGQSACLEMLGVRGANQQSPGENARKLAKIICATVMAGELSLMSALVNSDLVKSHMRHNRSSIAVTGNLNNKCSTIS